jgi:hypothetical protein
VALSEIIPDRGECLRIVWAGSILSFCTGYEKLATGHVRRDRVDLRINAIAQCWDIKRGVAKILVPGREHSTAEQRAAYVKSKPGLALYLLRTSLSIYALLNLSMRLYKKLGVDD